MALVQIPDEEEYVYSGPVLQMSSAVLPSDYPLFDWADWPKSRAALVPGGVTRNFERDCWNALMDHMNAAAEDAGFSFYDSEAGYGELDLKMLTGAFGRLTADRMNAVVAAFDKFLPWPWIWKFERDPPYPYPSYGLAEGYWSSSYFIGASDPHNRKPDTVYPEYILGLARRVNMLIRFMRNDYPDTLAMAGAGFAAITADPGLRAGPAAAINAGQNSRLLLSQTPVEVTVGQMLRQDVFCRVTVDPGVEKAVAGTLSIPVYRIGNPIKASGEVRQLMDLTVASNRVFSRSESALDCRELTELNIAAHMAAGTRKLEIYPVEGQPMIAQKPALTRTEAGAEKSRAMPLQMPQNSKNRAKAMPERHRAASCYVLHNSGIRSGVTLDSAWYPPVWENGGLYIRQAFGVQTYSDGSLSFAGAQMAMEARQISRMGAFGELDTAWYPPVWEEDGLWVRQTYGVVIMEDGGLNLAMAELPMEVSQLSEASAQAVLDSAWYPTVWTDGGLYIPQAHTIAVREDGSLSFVKVEYPVQAEQSSFTDAKLLLETGWILPVRQDSGLRVLQAQEIKPMENGELEVQ